MMSKPSKLWRWAAVLILALGCLSASVFCYLRSLIDEPISARRAIPLAELSAAPEFACRWSIPKEMRSSRWSRVGLVVWESGRKLPLRVEEEGMVSSHGNGRFSAIGDQLTFSALDNSNPLTNGRSYEIEVLRTSYRDAVLAVGFLALALALLIGGLPLKRWFLELRLRMDTESDGMKLGIQTGNNQRAQIYRITGAALIGLAALAWILLPRFRFPLHVPIPPATIIQQTDGLFRYHLPAWIRRDPFRFETLLLCEDGRLLRRINLRNQTAQYDTNSVLHNAAPGTYFAEYHYLWFQPSDVLQSQGARAGSRSEPAEHQYLLNVYLFHAEACGWWWSLFYASLGLVMAGQGGLWPVLLRKIRAGSETSPPIWADPRGQWAGWRIPVLFVSLFKLWIIAGDDSMGQLADGSSYANLTANMIWGGGLGLTSHPGGFPLVAGIVAQFGLPWRMGLELLYLAVCYFLSRDLLRLSGSNVAGFLVFLFMAWHPWPFSGFCDFMSDPVVLVITVALMALMFRLLSRSTTAWKWPTFVALGGLLFLWEWCRNETPLICASYGVFILLSLTLARLREGLTMQQIPRLAVLLAMPLVIFLSLSNFVKFVYYQRSGVYSKSVVDLPGTLALMKALYQIKPEETLRYAPVTRQSLHAACEASPTLKQYEDALLDPNAGATQFGQQGTERPGEFGSFLNWLLPQNMTNDLRIANAQMFKAADEINTALKTGKLPRRRGTFPLDPNFGLWIPDLPRALWDRLKDGTTMAPAGEPWGTFHGPILQRLFDAAANRRAANIYPQELLAEGSVTGPAGAIDSVALTDDEGRWLCASLAYKSNWWAHGQAFDLHAFTENEQTNYHLVFLRQGKPQHEVNLLLPPADPNKPTGFFSRSAEKKENGIGLPEQGGTFSYVCRVCFTQPVKQARRAAMESVLRMQYRSTLFFALAIVGFSAVLRRRWEAGDIRTLFYCLLLASAWFLARVAFYAVIDATLAWRTLRYVGCISPVFVLLLFLGAIVATGSLQKRFSSKALRPARQPRQPDGKIQVSA